MWGAILDGVQHTPHPKKIHSHLWRLVPASVAATTLLFIWLLYRPTGSVPTSTNIRLAQITNTNTPTPNNVKKQHKPTPSPLSDPHQNNTHNLPKTHHTPAHTARPKPLPTPLPATLPTVKPLTTQPLHPLLIAKALTTDSQASQAQEQKKYPTLPHTPHTHHRMSASLLISNIPGGASNIKGYGGLYATASNVIDYNNNPSEATDKPTQDDEKNAQELISLYNQAQGTAISVHRHPPIRAGLLASYPLTHSLYLESGILYTKESTDLKQGSKDYYTQTTYHDHLLGIPLTLRYDFVKTNRWSLHLAVSVLGEAMLHTSRQTYYSMPDNKIVAQGTPSRDPNEKTLRWSVRGGVGLRYALTKKVGLFVQPGVTKQLTTLGRTYEKLDPQNLSIDGVAGLSLDF